MSPPGRSKGNDRSALREGARQSAADQAATDALRAACASRRRTVGLGLPAPGSDWAGAVVENSRVDGARLDGACFQGARHGGALFDLAMAGGRG